MDNSEPQKLVPRKLGLERKKPTRAKVEFTVFVKDKRKNESWSLILSRKKIIPTKNEYGE